MLCFSTINYWRGIKPNCYAVHWRSDRVSCFRAWIQHVDSTCRNKRGTREKASRGRCRMLLLSISKQFYHIPFSLKPSVEDWENQIHVVRKLLLQQIQKNTFLLFGIHLSLAQSILFFVPSPLSLNLSALRLSSRSQWSVRRSPRGSRHSGCGMGRGRTSTITARHADDMSC